MDRNDPKAVVSAFFLQALRPAVRLLLRYGISYRDMAELLKQACVDVATEQFGQGDRPASVSAVALQTGMTRRDVRRFRKVEPDPDARAFGHLNLAGRVLSGWFQDREFCAADGIPLPLPENGPSPSFADLARRYAADVPASATLKELVRSGAVVTDAIGRLVATSRDYMPGIVDPAAPEAVSRSGSVLEDIGNTVEHNLVRGPAGTPRFERRATNINLDPAAEGKFRDLVNREGQAFLERIDAWLTEHELSGDGGDAAEPVRLGLGMYWIQDPANAAAAAS